MQGEIDRLIQFIAEHFPFDEETYPKLKNASDQERLLFALNHSALHFGKTAGKIIAVSESADHGGESNIAEIKTNIPKALINTLRLAELVGMTEAEIIQAIEKKYNDRIK